MNDLISEPELLKTLPAITKRKLIKLCRRRLVPFFQVDRFTRVYDLDEVVAALKVNAKKNGAPK
jgi:hypothetical protein